MLLTGLQTLIKSWSKKESHWLTHAYLLRKVYCKQHFQPESGITLNTLPNAPFPTTCKSSNASRGFADTPCASPTGLTAGSYSPRNLLSLNIFVIGFLPGASSSALPVLAFLDSAHGSRDLVSLRATVVRSDSILSFSECFRSN